MQAQPAQTDTDTRRPTFRDLMTNPARISERTGMIRARIAETAAARQPLICPGAKTGGRT